MEKQIAFLLNGNSASIKKTEPERSLLWILRTDFALTGPKYSCGQRYCGACSRILQAIESVAQKKGTER